MQTLTPTIPPIIEGLDESHLELVGLYEEAFGLPGSSVEANDLRAEQLEAVDSLAEETVKDEALIAMLRQSAFMRVDDAKRRQQARTEWGGATDQPLETKAAVEASEPDESERRKTTELPIVKPERVIRALRRIGLEVVPGGKGSHIKVFNPDNGKTTTIPTGHKGVAFGPKLIGAILGQVEVSREAFKENL